MKHVTILLCILFALSAGAQINPLYKMNGDTLILKGKKIAPGDTVFLGWGSGINKRFLYLYWMPTMLNASTDGPAYLSNTWCNNMMIFKEVEEKKFFGKKYQVPVFYAGSSKKLKISGDLMNAVEAGEIKIE